jgi:hypothetical protein
MNTGDDEYTIVNSLIDYRNCDSDCYIFDNPMRCDKRNNVYYDSDCYYVTNQEDNTISNFFIETKKLNTPTGIYNIGNDYMMDLEIPRGSQLLNYFISNDDICINTVHENSERWFSDQPDYDEIREKYRPVLLFQNEYSEVDNEHPILRTYLDVNNGIPNVEVFNTDNEPCDLSDIDANSNLVCILRFKGIRFLKSSFHPIYIVQKIKIMNNNNSQQLKAPDFTNNTYSDDESVDMHDEPPTFSHKGSDDDLSSINDEDINQLLSNFNDDTDSNNNSDDDDDEQDSNNNSDDDDEQDSNNNSDDDDNEQDSNNNSDDDDNDEDGDGDDELMNDLQLKSFDLNSLNNTETGGDDEEISDDEDDVNEEQNTTQNNSNTLNLDDLVQPLPELNI